jgi:glycosyltransferase involved in cell wall biosynthesis
VARSPEDSFGADVTLVHEWLTNVAGSEKVVDGLRRAFPGAPVSTSVWWPPAFPGWDVRPSALQRFVGGPSAHVRLLPFLPAAFASLRLPPAATVITSFHTFALYARVPPSAHHIAYCHTPPRFLWLSDQLTTERLPLPGPLAGAAAAVLRPVDVRRARRPDVFLANSGVTARRVEAAYGRGADVVHPPVDIERFSAARRNAPDDYHLVLSRLVPYKRIELAVAAFTELGWRLVVAGTGRAEAALREMAGPTIEFVGHVADADLPALVAGARALVFPGVEDFGIVPVEAMAAGTPVVAFASGGATETVVDGRSGTFFDEPTVASLVAAVRRADGTSWDRVDVSRSVERFAQDRFAREVRDVVASLAGSA